MKTKDTYKPVFYLDDKFDYRQGEIVEKNGNLTLVTDVETGGEHWLAPFEVEVSNYEQT